MIYSLIDYTKKDACCPNLSLFFSFHWSRHHVKDVNEILNNSHSFDELHNNIKNMLNQPAKNINITGSLSRRVRFIESLLETQVKDTTYIKTNKI